MIDFIESWATYASTADIVRRWVYQYGNGGALSAGGCLVNGSVVSYCNTHVRARERTRIGFKFRCDARPTQTSSFLHLMQSGETNSENHIGLGMDTAGRLVVFYGVNFTEFGGTTLATGTKVLAVGTTYWIELDVLERATATGSVELRVDGVAEIVLSNVRTSPSASPWIDHVGIVAGNASRNWFGTLYMGDGADAWLGPASAYYLSLAADGAQKDFTPSAAGSNFALLNDLANFATYVASSKIPATDLYPIAAMPTSPLAVHAVQVAAEALQSTRSKAVVPVVSLDGLAVGDGSVLPPAATPLSWYKEPRAVHTAKPGGGAWDAAAVARLLVGPRVASWVKGLNFRQTAAYVTDPPHCTYVLNDPYPTTRGGVTFGWTGAAGTYPALNRSATVDPLYAGVNTQQNNGTQRTFRVDVPAPGRYQVRLILGDYGQSQRALYCQAKDGANVLFTINPSAGTSLQAGVDAAGWYLYQMVGWAEFNTPRVVTLTGTSFELVMGTPAAGFDWSCIAHLELVALDYLAPVQTIAPEVQVAGLYTEVLVSDAAAPLAFRIDSVTPASAHTSGGGAITIAGAGFEEGTVVLFGGHPGSVTVVSAAALSVVVPPAAAAGTVALVVRLPNGTERSSTFAYEDAAVLSVSPTTMQLAGGVLQVNGKWFATNAIVLVDGAPVATTYVSATQLQATVPAVALGWHRVAVANGSLGTTPEIAQAFLVVAPASLGGIVVFIVT